MLGLRFLFRECGFVFSYPYFVRAVKYATRMHTKSEQIGMMLDWRSSRSIPRPPSCEVGEGGTPVASLRQSCCQREAIIAAFEPHAHVARMTCYVAACTLHVQK
jgi:hypothetical protein